MSDDTSEQALYRFFNDAGDLLYVGISIHPFTRMSQHRAEKDWWPEVSSVRIARYASRSEVMVAEVEAIRSENPLYNKVRHVPRKRRRPPVVCTVTYWENAINAPIDVHNVLPSIDGELVNFACPYCQAVVRPRRITDHGANEFAWWGMCEACQRPVQDWNSISKSDYLLVSLAEVDA